MLGLRETRPVDGLTALERIFDRGLVDLASRAREAVGHLGLSDQQFERWRALLDRRRGGRARDPLDAQRQHGLEEPVLERAGVGALALRALLVGLDKAIAGLRPLAEQSGHRRAGLGALLERHPR